MTTGRRLALRPAATLLIGLLGLVAPAFVARGDVRHWIWMAGLIGLGLPIVWRTVVGLFQGRFAADVVASLALVAAIALDQPFAGLVIVLMQTGGEALEDYAARRASRAVEELEAEAPRTAHLITAEGVEDVPVATVAPGDRVLVRPGETIPCDGVVADGRSALDTARITGEPVPREVEPGTAIVSGTINLHGPLVVQVTAPAEASVYAQIVELVRRAQASKAPLQRLADRAAVWFTPLTIGIAGLAWIASGDPIRALAVLVIATPCPLILAAPVAMLGGIGRAARHQVIVRNGTALEQLARVDTVVFDKTGTLTIGHPVVERVTPLGDFDEATVLRLAGAVEHGSGHLLARTTVAAAESRVGRLPDATNVVEAAGRGVTGTVGGARVTVGSATLIRDWEPEAAAAFRALDDGAGPVLQAQVVIDGAPAGLIGYADRIRPEAPRVVESLRSLGLARQVILSGDRAANAAAAARLVGITEVEGDLLPQDKVAFVARLGREGRRVLMVGDGANDAPALSAAAVGMAVASKSGGISAEAADVVLLVDDLTRVPEAVAIARRTFEIARQSIGVGLGLSLLGMAFAAFGQVPPTVGALLQEGIDVAVILNALRVLRPGPLELALHHDSA
ncbi:MAG: heavy metal translocating P-type ATPase [Gemmatimonadales bacterium]